MNKPEGKRVSSAPLGVIGPLSFDRIQWIGTSETVEAVGGGVYYVAHTWATLSARVAAFPILSSSDKQALEGLIREGISIAPIWAEETAIFEITYDDRSSDARRLTCRAHPKDVFPTQATFDALSNCVAVHVAPLMSDDFHPDFFRALRRNFPGIISLDAQGLTRGKKYEPEKLLKNNVDILKVDSQEALILSEASNVEQAVRIFLYWGISEVQITHGSKGSAVYCFQGHIDHVEADPVAQVLDTTGCGDAYAAAYLLKRIMGAEPTQAAHFASSIAARNATVKGPLKALSEL